MQQTEHLKLNIIEGGDPVDWEVMNENFRTLEGKVVQNGEAAVLAAEFISGTENCRIAWGSYTGTGTYGAASPTSLTTGFAPVLVIVQNTENVGNDPAILIRGMTVGRNNLGKSTLAVSWRDDGVSWYTTNTTANIPAAIQMNTADQTFYYAAIGYAAG